ncbi:MAG: cheW [Candidatus Peribacteria bacterium]|nr:cheW [Candidatus Peribacteria bacterium]
MTANSTLSATASQKEIQLLVFRAANEEFAFHLTDAREIIRMSDVTLVPGVPLYVRGIMNLRGRILTVIDLAAFLGTADTAEKKQDIIVVEKGKELFGFLVESVTGVRHIAADDAKAMPELADSCVPAGYIDSAVMSNGTDDAKTVPVLLLILSLQNMLAPLTAISRS